MCEEAHLCILACLKLCRVSVLISIPCICCSFSKVNFKGKTTFLLLSFAILLYHYTLHGCVRRNF